MDIKFIFICFAYLIGAIPIGYWLCKYFFNIDITLHGSGNIGATNVARTLGKHWFLLVFLLDAGKAFVMISLCQSSLLNNVAMLYLTVAALLIGNSFSVFLNFKGGKGVATTVGIAASLLPITVTLLFCILWLITVACTHKPFIASLSSVMVVLIVYWGVHAGDHTLLFFIIFLWLCIRHLPNLYLWWKFRTNNSSC